MPDILTPEPVLGEELAAWSARADTGVVVAEHTGRTIVRLEWRRHDEPRPAGASLPALGDVAACGAALLMRTSPVSAMAISDAHSPRELVESFADGRTSVVDVSHGFVVLQLHGTAARALLDGLVPLDLSALVFRLDTICCTQIAAHGVTIHCTAADAFDLYVDRSYAWSLWRYLRRCLETARG